MNINYYLKKLKGNPLALLKRAIIKTCVEPFRYATKNGYQAEKYWQDRHAKYGMDILGPGDHTQTKEENIKMYQEAREIFIKTCRKDISDFKNIKVLEIGCGNGFYTQILNDLGVLNYTALDIVDVLFPELRKKFPSYRFLKKDVSQKPIEGQFDLIVMIDVIEHIVEKAKFQFALKNIQTALAPSGKFYLSPVGDKSGRHLYYVYFWSLEEITSAMEGCRVNSRIPFRFSQLLTIAKG